jgi:hypothetical protein
MNLVRHLNALGKEVNAAYRYINCGGCCVYASLVATELKKLGVEVHGIVGSWYAEPSKNIDNIRPLVKKGFPSEWGENGVYFGHVGLEFKIRGKVKHYDSNGVSAPKGKIMGLLLYDGRMLPKELKVLASTSEGWNTQFDRRHIPDIRQLVKKHMAKVDMTPGTGRRQPPAAA